ncbi:GNAT family N-acetyltransferase [Streptomyces formicae]|uniref:GNAT family N-acetyltransferase n=1 Tax=Streptomyces formicae TaxID=1616117 RepID=UPI001F57C2AA|nr:GNAT family N-acetyltransferase [Streptomyces formicae]
MDRPDRPRAVAVSAGNHALLRGEAGVLAQGALAPLTGHCIEAPARFLPAIGAAFQRVVPWERPVYVHRVVPVTSPCPPRGVTVRRLTADDAPALAALVSDAAWIHDSWGGPYALATSGLGVAAFHKEQILAVAGTYILGSAYEDIAVVTTPGHRRRHLALACVTSLCYVHHAAGRPAPPGARRAA